MVYRYGSFIIICDEMNLSRVVFCNTSNLISYVALSLLSWEMLMNWNLKGEFWEYIFRTVMHWDADKLIYTSKLSPKSVPKSGGVIVLGLALW